MARKPDQEGVDGKDQKDPTGKYFSREMHKVAVEQGQGFVDYQYAKPGAPLDQPSPKLSFVKFFAPWRWTVGTGVYIDDLNAKIWSQVYLSSGVAAVFALIIGGIAGGVVLSLSNRLNALGAAMTRLAAGDYEAPVPASSGRDEVDHMNAAVHVFQDAARARARLEANAETTRQEAEHSRASFDSERAERERKLEEATGALGLGLEKLAGGDLAHRIEIPFETRLDKLRLDFNGALEKLRQTMVSVRENADGLRSGVEEIAHASDNLSARTEQQAASLEETAAALDEITSQLKSSAQGVKDASTLVATANNDAQARRRGRQAGRRGDGGDFAFFAADRADHRRDRRDRVPDQSARAQRGRGSGARGRRRQGLCGGRLRGARAGAAFGGRGQGDQVADRGLGRRKSKRASNSSPTPAAVWSASSRACRRSTA